MARTAQPRIYAKLALYCRGQGTVGRYGLGKRVAAATPQGDHDSDLARDGQNDDTVNA